MQIPLGSASQRVIAQPEQDSFAPAGAFDHGAGALGAVGGALGAIGDEAARVAAQQRHEDYALARAKGGEALLDNQEQHKTLASEIAQRVADGSLHYKDAAAAYTSASQLIEAPQIDGLRPVDQEVMQKGFLKNQQTGAFSVQAAAQAGRKAEFKTVADSSIDGLLKVAGYPGADMGQVVGRIQALDSVGQLAHGGAWGKVKQDAIDAAWFNQAAQVQALNRDNLPALETLNADLASGKYVGLLDTQKRSALITSTTTRIDQLKAQGARVEDKREAAAQAFVAETDGMIARGETVSAERWAQGAAVTRGTIQDGVQEQQQRQSVMLSQLSNLPPDKQQQFVNDQQASLEKTGSYDAKGAALVKRMQATVESNIKQLVDDPLAYQANRTGTPVAPLDLKSITSPEGAQKVAVQLADRMLVLKGMQRQYGETVPLAPLQRSEAQGLEHLISEAPDATKKVIFGGLATSTPPETYLAIMKQLKVDPVLQMAGIATGQGLMTKGGIAIGDALLAGRAILKDKSVVLPKTIGMAGVVDGEDGLQNFFNTNVGDAMQGGSRERENAYQVFRAMYAATGQRKGTLNALLDADTAKEALTSATGGIGTWPPGSFFSSGKKVVKPFGMDDDVFHDKVDAQMRSVAPQSAGFSYDDLRRLPLLNLPGTDRYFILSGRKQVSGKDGKPLMIDLTPGPSVTGLAMGIPR